MFQLCTTTVGEVFNIWVNFLYCQLREIDLWPSGDTISENMPQNFARLFPDTKMILNATEVPIQKPRHAEAQSVTFSSCKDRNTVKTLIGCTPRGVVRYVGDNYGGSASDRQMVERSALMKDYPFKAHRLSLISLLVECHYRSVASNAIRERHCDCKCSR